MCVFARARIVCGIAFARVHVFEDKQTEIDQKEEERKERKREKTKNI